MEPQSPSHPTQPEHFISLPLVDKSLENPQLPLAINVVAKYWGEDIEITEKVPKNSPRGTTIIDGIDLVERRGLACFIFKGSLRDIKKRIDQGMPPIVIMPGIQGIVQHAMVISGYDPDERRVLTYVPEPDTIGAIPEHKFEQDWEQDEMTEILILPSDMTGIVEKENLKFSESNRLCFESEKSRQAGKIEEALRMLSKATSVDPENVQAWTQLAGIYNEQGSYQAVSLYDRAIKMNPRYYLAHRGLGNYYLKKKDYLIAEAHYTQAISINPMRYGPIYKNRAVARIESGNTQGAKEDLVRYLEQTPDATDRKSIEDAILHL